MVGSRSRGAAPMLKSPRPTGAENIDDRPNAAIDRRSFLASGAAVVAIAEAPAAQAAEAIAWDREVDVVVIGAGAGGLVAAIAARSEEHTSELQSQSNLVCRLLLEKKKK